MNKTYPTLLALLLQFCLANFCHAQPDGNLVTDGGFEHGASGWRFVSSGADATGQLDPTEKHEGNFSYKLKNKSGFAPNQYARIFQFVSGLRPYTTYRISCWAKGKAVGITWIGGGPGWNDRHWFPKGDFDWQQFSFELDTGAMPDSYELMVVTESQTEALWVDDVRFEPIRVDHAKQDALYAEFKAQTDRLLRRIANLEQQARSEPGLASSAYFRLGLAVARRFISFAQNGGPDGRSGLAWSRLQLEEIAQVLDETENLARERKPALLDWRPPQPGSVRLKNGTFYQNGRPFYFAGYGHFDSVIKDLPDFPALGASLIQDGRAGPSSMNADGTLGKGRLRSCAAWTEPRNRACASISCCRPITTRAGQARRICRTGISASSPSTSSTRKPKPRSGNGSN